MKKSKFNEEQIAFALHQADIGTSVEEVCRKIGISKATFYAWKKKFGGMGVTELRRLRQLEEENRKVKQLVADLSLFTVIVDSTVLHKAIAYPTCARTLGPLASSWLRPPRTRPSNSSRLSSMKAASCVARHGAMRIPSCTAGIPPRPTASAKARPARRLSSGPRWALP